MVCRVEMYSLMWAGTVVVTRARVVLVVVVGARVVVEADSAASVVCGGGSSEDDPAMLPKTAKPISPINTAHKQPLAVFFSVLTGLAVQVSPGLPLFRKGREDSLGNVLWRVGDGRR